MQKLTKGLKIIDKIIDIGLADRYLSDKALKCSLQLEIFS